MSDEKFRSGTARSLVRLSVRSPRVVLLWCGLAAVVASVGVFQLRVETSTDSLLDHSDSGWRFFQKSQEIFGGDQFLTILINGKSPFDPDVLADVTRLSAQFAALPGVERIDSLATVPLIYATSDGQLSVEAPLAHGVPKSLTELAQRVRGDRIAPRTLVSADERAFAINLVLQRDADVYFASVLHEIKKALGDREAWISGVPIFRAETEEHTRSELAVLVPLTLAVMSVLLLLLFGSLRAVVIPMASSGLGTWLLFGVMGGLGVPVTVTLVILPTVFLALGCAYSVHLLSAVSGIERSEYGAALERVSLPILLSGLTTTLGLVAISFIRIEAIRHVGAFGALGVLIITLVTLTAGPAALVLWPLSRAPNRFQRYLGGRAVLTVVSFGGARRRGVIAGWLVAVALVSVGAARLQVETDVTRWFRHDDPVRIAYEAIRARLSGISPMNVVVTAAGSGSVSSAAAIAAIDRLSTYLEALPEVGRTLSVADPLRQLHGGFVGDPSHPLPGNDQLIGQYLLLLESKDYMGVLITRDRSAANVLLRVNNNSSDALVGVAVKVADWWAVNGVAGYEARATGIMYEIARAEEAIAYGQLRGLLLAFLAVLAIFIGMFRWLRLALLALVPNVLPIAMGFGAMGLFGVPLDVGTVLVGNLAFGIAVDNSVHTVTHFYSELQHGAESSAALESAFRRVLPPVVYTTLAVTAGFAVLGFSEFAFIQRLGVMTAALMVLCFFADVVLFPALIAGLEAPRKLLASRGAEIDRNS